MFRRWWSARKAEKALRALEYELQNSEIWIEFMIPKDEEEAIEMIEEDGQYIFVAATGKFDSNWDTHTLNPDGIPKFGYYIYFSGIGLTLDSIEPDFSARKNDLALIAQSTCQAFWPMESGKFKQGTAFFISPTILLTAGHVGPIKGQKVAIQPPGKLKLDLYYSNLWRASKENKARTDVFNCKVLKTLYNKGNVNIDISILKSLEYRASTWVPIDMSMPLMTESAVDLIGYPGEVGRRYLNQVQGFDVSESQRSFVSSILPAYELIVSHGKVLHGNDICPRYKLSTTYGMSGGAIIFQGKVVGKIPSQDFILTKLSIPLAMSRPTTNASP